MLLRRDLVSGGIISDNKHELENPYSNCRCDGQFGEHMTCRELNQLFSDTTPRDLGICSRLKENEQFRFYKNGQFMDAEDWQVFKEANCADPNSRGVLLFMQGGPHFKSDADKYISQAVEHVIQSSEFLECVKYGKVHVVWAAYTAQSRRLDEKYP